ncbi:hypothetical protein P3342_008778 [Pyrenophora teres f. teres]|uniref:AP2 domain containing protein n=1 Tax=Pyrenophora teres f. teres TaxID=97479 RepID=A0A6S6W6J4_9PLEO|nr:hypothetical protein HRS9139_07494 [Pyrenophora teres f. teres]KAE8830876.1 hypothetical protein PTNB85_07463 [Pyrenophora teres f. teres]KAE8857126.1 hypothetical protein PTNB29_08193 [Pyrenophora teres f. teres]KAK1910897.1 hypothetical protein P3342_008778 [Pyrenophora teres f. teres]CAE7187616.1 AP2 domain containing protein [Pyrenophora teres f. teres]
MFPSVKDRARQLFGEAAFPSDVPTPPPVATGRRGAPPKADVASKPSPELKTPAKVSRTRNAPPPVEETPKPIGAWPSPLEQFRARRAQPEKISPPPSPSKQTPKSAAASKPASSAPPKAEKTEKSSSSKKTTSQTKLPAPAKAAAPPKKVTEPKAVPLKKKPEPKPAPKLAPKPAPEPKKQSRPKPETRISSRPKMERSSSSSSLEDDEYGQLRTACLREVSKVTGLKGKNLAISLRQRSSGEWYAALKDVNADKYLKMWMNRDKTFETQEEALEAYLIFAKKMNTDTKLFGPMSPKLGKSKGSFF